jgi:microcystin-dependent protein
MSYKIDGVTQVFSVPIGSISAYLGTSDPEGFVLCDGVTRDNTDGKYNDLYDLSVGNKSETNNTYTPPDYRGMFIGGSSATASVGGTGGNNNVTLNTTNLPAHNHQGSTASNGSHFHEYKIYKGNDLNFSGAYSGPYDLGTDDQQGSDTTSTQSAGNHNHSFTTNNTGDGTAFSIVPEHVKVNYIIKY